MHCMFLIYHLTELYLGSTVLSVKCGGPFTMYSPSDPRTKETKEGSLVMMLRKTQRYY